MKNIILYTILICILFILLSSVLCFPQDLNLMNADLYNTHTRLYPTEKDPFIAGLLSWLMMGTGQIYCREYTKGSIFIAADLADKAAFVLLLSYINNRYASAGTEIINIDWNAFDTGTKLLTVLYFTGTLSLRFYNVLDAINSANIYNKKYFSQREKSTLTFSIDHDKFFLRYNIHFSE